MSNHLRDWRFVRRSQESLIDDLGVALHVAAKTVRVVDHDSAEYKGERKQIGGEPVTNTYRDGERGDKCRVSAGDPTCRYEVRRLKSAIADGVENQLE